MEITPNQTAATAAAAASAKASARAAEPAASNEMASDFETFLMLLTAQMRNQDPLKPMESTEFVAQLASFSSVEQQVRTNDGLDRIFDLLSGGTADGLAAWIGKEVRAPGKVEFTGTPIDVEVTPVSDTDRSVLVVTNDFGQEVARRVVEPDAGIVVWDGTTDVGSEVPHGRYGFALEGYSGNTLTGTTPGLVYAPVREVRFQDGQPVLVVEDGAQVPLGEVTALR